MKTNIGQRIRTARERRNVLQTQLAEALGWKNAQTVSDIEHGKRELKAWELFKIARFLHIEPTLLISQDDTRDEIPMVLWREKPVKDEKLLAAKFISQCETYTWLESLVFNTENGPLKLDDLPKVKIDLDFFEPSHAYQLAEKIRSNFVLGDFPASQLINVLEERYNIKFIIDNSTDVTAACTRSDNRSFILLNGNNPSTRLFFSIAHELFHLITWDKDLLKLVENNTKYHKKNESLANAFAGGLLIPREKIISEISKFNNPIKLPELIVLSEQFQVSREAFLYRLLNIGIISEAELKEMIKQLPQLSKSRTLQGETLVESLKNGFVRLIYLAYEHGKISRARAAKLLNVDLYNLSESFNNFGFIEVNES